MSYRRSFRRLAAGLSIASIGVATCVSAAAAMHGGPAESPVRIPSGETQHIDWSAVEVIPYLSHGMLTAPDAQSASRTGSDPYLTDVNVRPGESLGGPDGGPAPKRDAQQQQSAGDTASGLADQCRRLDVKDPEQLEACARRGFGETTWTDRD